MAYRKEQIIEAIQALGVAQTDTLMIHSSMKAIGEVSGGADTVLDAFGEYLREGLLVFPTHTWETVTPKSNFYDYRTEPACVGLLPELFRKRPGVFRSLHPTHSVAALGRDAESFTFGEEYTSTPCSRRGCLGKLLDRNGRILFLGCSPARNTFLHGVEEWNEVPDRLTEETVCYRILLREDGGHPRIREQRYHELHSDLVQNGDVSVHYGKIMPVFLKEGIARQGRLCDASCIVADCRGMYDITSDYLRKNPMLFNDFSDLL